MIRLSGVARAAVAVLALAASSAEARITRVEITGTESPTFGGFSWPGVGQYEKIVGKAFGEVDPADPKNSVIVDIGLAPRNARGNVEYAHNFCWVDNDTGLHAAKYFGPRANELPGPGSGVFEGNASPHR
jgi:hypothetical protein